MGEAAETLATHVGANELITHKHTSGQRVTCTGASPNCSACSVPVADSPACTPGPLGGCPAPAVHRGLDDRGGTLSHSWDSPPLGSADATSLSSFQDQTWDHLPLWLEARSPLLGPALFLLQLGTVPWPLPSSAPCGRSAPAWGRPWSIRALCSL